MIPTRARPLLVALCLVSAGCFSDDITVNVPPAPSPVVPASSTIELRVLGNAQTVRVRHVNPVDGLSQVHTVLPYIVTIRTDQTVMFLSLEVTPIAYPFDVVAPFLSAQIFVNGFLFREGSAADFSLATVAVSGTWRK